jgi:hypothetical protein
MRALRAAILLTIALLLASTVSGCCPFFNAADEVGERVAEEVVEDATGGDVDIEEGEVTITGEDGEEVVISDEGAELPDGFWDDFPTYDGKIIGSAKMTDDSGREIFTVFMETSDDYTTVMDAFKSDLEDMGWKTEFSAEVPEGEDGLSTFHVSKGERNANVTISDENAVTSIALTLGYEE